MNDTSPDENASAVELAEYLKLQLSRLAELNATREETLKRIEQVTARLKALTDEGGRS